MRGYPGKRGQSKPHGFRKGKKGGSVQYPRPEFEGCGPRIRPSRYTMKATKRPERIPPFVLRHLVRKVLRVVFPIAGAGLAFYCILVTIGVL
jgi:hypothetical protein